MYLQKLLKIILTSVLVIFIISYAGYKLYPLIKGPEIIIYTPKNGDRVSGGLVEIKGVVSRAKYIKLFDREIYTNQKGEFTEKMIKQNTYTDIIITATDRFGRTVSEKLWVE
jgi:hypothetical protein